MSPSAETRDADKRIKSDIPDKVRDQLNLALVVPTKQAVTFFHTEDPDVIDGAIVLFLLALVSAVSKTSIKDRFFSSLPYDEAAQIVAGMGDEDKAVAVKSLQDGKWETFLNLPDIIAKVESVGGSSKTPLSVMPRSPKQLVMISGAWNLKYVGKSHELLWQHITEAHTNRTDVYAMYCAIIQSSGMGKSRLIDQLAKERFVIPINIRADKVGWPPEDDGVRAFLIRDLPNLNGRVRFQAFFIALFVEIARVLEQKDESKEKMSHENSFLFEGRVQMCQWFQSYMSPQSKAPNPAHNPDRKQLYHRVVGRATTILEHLTLEETDPIARSATSGREIRSADKKALAAASPKPKSELRESLTSDLLTPLIPADDVVDDPNARVNLNDISSRFIAFLKKLHPPPRNDGYTVEVVCAFDEAHTLEETTKGEPLNGFETFRRAIRQLNDQIFTVFLSTNAQISTFHPKTADDPSNRVTNLVFHIPPPFVDLPFDILANKVADSGVSLDQVPTWLSLVDPCRWASHLRAGLEDGFHYEGSLPEFAAQKLLGHSLPEIQTPLTDSEELAVFSTLLSLDYHSQTVNDRKVEEKQVARHMRVCCYVTPDFHTILTTSPSEPILAEGAIKCLKRTNVKPGEMLNHVLGSPLVAAGERGEHVAAFLFLRAAMNARDYTGTVKLPLPVFLKHFIGADVSVFKPSVSSGGRASLGTAFSSAHVYFNHVVKLGSHEVANSSLIWTIVARGGLVVLANCHKGADLYCPICMEDQVTGGSTSYMIVQIKRDGSITFSAAPALFSAMNPVSIGLFPAGQTLKHPIIRLVMNFAAAEGVKRLSPDQAASRPQSNNFTDDPEIDTPNAKFTSYDIWCGGLSHKIYPCIQEEEVDHYRSALHICTPLSKVFKGMTKERVNVRRSQMPAYTTEEGHWGWTSLVST